MVQKSQCKDGNSSGNLFWTSHVEMQKLFPLKNTEATGFEVFFPMLKFESE